MSKMKRLLSVKELAVELGVCVYTIRRAYWKGTLPAFKICKVLRFDLERVWEALRTQGLGEALHAGAVRIGASRPRGAGTPPTSKTGALRAGPLRKSRPWTKRRSS